jgi:hypothetical protein
MSRKIKVRLENVCQAAPGRHIYVIAESPVLNVAPMPELGLDG